MEMMLWDGALTLGVAIAMMWINSVNDENKRI